MRSCAHLCARGSKSDVGVKRAATSRRGYPPGDQAALGACVRGRPSGAWRQPVVPVCSAVQVYMFWRVRFTPRRLPIA